MNATTTPTDNDLQADMIASGTAAKSHSYEIADEHRHHADAILAMNPLEAPRPIEYPDGWAASLQLKASALPPAQQQEVASKLAAFGSLSPEAKAAKEAELTAQAIRSQRSRLITQIGVGPDATPYHRELAALAAEVADLDRQHDYLQRELERVDRYDMKFDPATGESKAVPVYAVTGTRARAYADQQRDLERRIRLLAGSDGTNGLEGGRRLKQAMYESVQARVEIRRQQSEEAEAKRRAEQINAERRINARAESLARLQRNGG